MTRMLVLLLTLLAPAAQAFDQQSLMKVFFSVVLVRGYNPDGSLAYGSGVVVGENKVVTNCHVLRKPKQAWVSQGEEAFEIVSVHADALHDLCLVNTAPMPLPAIALGTTTGIGQGDEAVSLGHSNGVPAPTVSRGQVKSVYAFGSGNVVRTNAKFSLGASGSALFDGQGRLIGINTFKTPGRNAFFYAIPVEWIAVAERIAPTKLPVSGQAFWELPDDKKPFFMQVALPHLNEDWTRLREISQRWIETEPDNAEAWFEHGVAQEGLGQPEEALRSYHRSFELDARHAEALYRIGMLASRRGDQNEIQNVSAQLARINVELAGEFDKAVGCGSMC